MDTVLTTCPFCACGCGLYLQARDGTLLGVAPSEGHPVARGRLCARGWGAHEAPAWGERLTRPLLRRNGTLEPVSWKEALAGAFSGIFSVRVAGKSVAVLGSARASNEENFLAAKLARAALRTANLDCCGRSPYHALLTGIAEVAGDSRPAGTLDDLERSEVILLLEGDLASTHPRIASSVIAALGAGAKLVTLGWVKTQMGRLAALHLPLTPGREVEALGSLIAAVLQAGPESSRVSAEGLPGINDLRESVSSLPIADELRQAAEWYARAERASILLSPTASATAQAQAGAATMLAALTGHLGRSGCALLALPPRGNLRGACDMGVAPDLLPDRRPLGDETARQPLQRGWGRATLIEPGLGAEEAMERVGGLIVVADDPSATLGSGKASLAAMERMDCVVLLDAFVTPALGAADVVLPIASFAETDGSVTNLEGRVQRLRACGPAPGEARPGWEVLVELINAFGYTVSYASADDVLREIMQVVPSYSGITQESLDDGWGAMTGCAGDSAPPTLHAVQADGEAAGDFPLVAAWNGVLDWGGDPLVRYSPTLNRDHLSQRKLFPRGFVTVSAQDAEALGVRQGWNVRLTSPEGTVDLPVCLSRDLQPGVVLLPFAFRDQLAGLLGGRGSVPVRLERT